MNIPFLCILLAFALIYIPRGIVVAALNKMDERFDNKHPREQQQRLTGWGARANAAHQNSFEAFAPFAAAVIVASISDADPTLVAQLSVAFIVARVIYIGLYVGNIAAIRSLVWATGAGITAWLFILAI